MDPTSLDEHSAACRLLDLYGDVAAHRGCPVWLLVRTVNSDQLETREVARSEGLLGQVVGPEWDAAAVVGTGRIRQLDEAHEPPAVLVPGLAGGLAMTCLVTRQGRVGWRMRLPDGTFYDRVPEAGFMLDILHRSLQLPTPPPETTSWPLDLSAWVATLIDSATEARRRLSWREALSLHPLGSEDQDGDPPDHIEARIVASATVEDWQAMRRLVAAGLPSDIAPPAEVAEWMDEGMFSRWLLRDIPSPDRLLAAVRPHLQPEAYRRLRHMSRSLDERTHVR
ncbi:MAG TPA: hypothetical protein VFH58_08880 [Acidimicrobiales bacterium]|nr:hypothetical protein [Acidimicrobiales bacterium]